MRDVFVAYRSPGACMVKRNHTSAAGSKVWHSLTSAEFIETSQYIAMLLDMVAVWEITHCLATLIPDDADHDISWNPLVFRKMGFPHWRMCDHWFPVGVPVDVLYQAPGKKKKKGWMICTLPSAAISCHPQFRNFRQPSTSTCWGPHEQQLHAV